MANPLGNLLGGGSINTSSIVAQTAKGLTIGLVIVAVLAVVYLIYYYLRHNISVTLIDMENKKVFSDRASIDKKEKKYVPLKHKEFYYTTPNSQHMHIKGKGYQLFGALKDGSVSWMTAHPNPGFKPANVNMLNHMVESFRIIYENTENEAGFWDKYGHQILWGFTMAVFLIVIVLILKRMDDVIAMANTVGQGAVESMRQQL